jgi:hypothetical protein
MLLSLLLLLQSLGQKVRDASVRNPGSAPGFLRDSGGPVKGRRLWSGTRCEGLAEELINAACLHCTVGQNEAALQVLERVFARG